MNMSTESFMAWFRVQNKLTQRLLWIVVNMNGWAPGNIIGHKGYIDFTTWTLKMSMWNHRNLSVNTIRYHLKPIIDAGLIWQEKLYGAPAYKMPYSIAAGIKNDMATVFGNHKEGAIFKIGRTVFQTKLFRLEKSLYKEAAGLAEIVIATAIASGNTHVFNREEFKKRKIKFLSAKEQASYLRGVVDEETKREAMRPMGYEQAVEEYPNQINSEIFESKIVKITSENEKGKLVTFTFLLESGREITITGNQLSVTTKNVKPETKIESTHDEGYPPKWVYTLAS